MIKYNYRMLVKIILMQAILVLTVLPYLIKARKGECDSCNRSVILSPSSSRLTSDESENYEDIPLKYLCNKLVRRLIVMYDDNACITAGQCVTYDVKDSLKRTTLGACPYILRNVSWCHAPYNGFYAIPSKLSLAELSNMTCGAYNREGLLCSSCKPGYGPAVYAFSQMCVKCTDNKLGWVLYISLVVTFVTVFYTIIILFNIKATSPPFTGFVLMCQTYCMVDRIYVPMTMKIVAHKRLKVLLHVVRLLCGIWNLDFFRHIIPPFCVSSHLNNLQVLTLEYFYVIYPFILIAMTFVCIELHARNFKLLIIVWKPFHKLLVWFRRAWDPRASIVNSFSTFLLLYVSKIILVSSFCLYNTSFVYTLGSDGHVARSFLYFSPSTPLYSKHHVPYLTASIIFLIIFTVIPSLLLCLYPIKVFRKMLHCCLFPRLQQGLWIFVETFQGYYKDGSDGQRDFRATSGAHFVILYLITSACIFGNVRFGLLPPVQLILASASLFYAIARPCKQAHANVIQSILLGLTAFILLLAYFVTVHIQTFFILLVMILCLLAPHIVLYGYAVYKVAKKVGRKYQKLHCLNSNCINEIVECDCKNSVSQQSDECTPLLKNLN